MEKSEVKSYDGKMITVYEWQVEKEPKGILFIAHEISHNGISFSDFAEYFSERCYIVVANDHRGHGETDKDSLGYCDGNMFVDTVKDIATIINLYSKKYTTLKIILFGFGYGSILVQSFLPKYSRLIDCVVLGGSTYIKNFRTYFGQITVDIFCKCKGEKYASQFLNKHFLKAYNSKENINVTINNDKKDVQTVEKENTTIYSNNLYRSAFHAMNALYTKNYSESLNKKMPILIISGKDDNVGDRGKGVKKLFSYYEKIGCEKAEIVLFDGIKHNFLCGENWENRAEIIKKFCDTIRHVSK